MNYNYIYVKHFVIILLSIFLKKKNRSVYTLRVLFSKNLKYCIECIKDIVNERAWKEIR